MNEELLITIIIAILASGTGYIMGLTIKQSNIVADCHALHTFHVEGKVFTCEEKK
jgi:hypothetical protein